MNGIPEKELEETRAALAPTLEAAAAILPLVARPQPLRFAPELNQRWTDACKVLAETWSNRHTVGADRVRGPIFTLLNVALETADIDCLRLVEALASTADRLEEGEPGARLIAAISAAIECLLEPGGLENSGFGERTRYCAQRLEDSLAPSHAPVERSAVLDRLFVNDALERLERMHEALEVLPMDIYALRTESHELTQHAEQIDMWGIVHLGRQLESFVLLMDEADAATQDKAADEISTLLSTLEQALLTVNA